MADSMEGVVATADPKPDVEQTAIAGQSAVRRHIPQHALHLPVPLRQLHDLMARPQDVPEPPDRDGPGVLQVPVPAS